MRERDYITSLLPWGCIIRCVCHRQTHSYCFYMLFWRICQLTRNTFIKSNIIWRYYLPCNWYVHKIPFLCSGIPTNIPQKTFCAWWCIFNAFVPTFAVAFHKTHGQNNTCKCDTEGFLPAASLNGMVGLPFLFIRSLIGTTKKMIYSIHYFKMNIRFQDSSMYHKWVFNFTQHSPCHFELSINFLMPQSC